MEAGDVAVEYTTIPGRESLIIRTNGFNTAVLNAIRRTMLQDIKCYGFIELMDPLDYKFLTGTKEERRNTVLTCTLNSQSIPVLAQRCSRLAIHTDRDTSAMLESNEVRKVFFVVSNTIDTQNTDTVKKSMTRPMVGENLITMIHSRDLVPVVFEMTDPDSESAAFEFSSEETQKLQDNMDKIFPYNELIAVVHHGQQLNIILNPVKGSGNENVRWSPCTFQYRFNMDPKWLEHDHGVAIKGQVRRKIEGARSFKHLFTHMPPENIGQPFTDDKAYNRFGRPYGHTLVFQYNGKMQVHDTFGQCLTLLNESIDHFYQRYIEAKTEGTMISKEESIVSSDDGTVNSKVTLLYIPKNTQDQMSEEDLRLTDHTIGNMISSKMLVIIDNLFQEKNIDDSYWSQTHIAYKIPHPLIKQCQIMIKIPDILDIDNDELVRQAVDAIKQDLQVLALKVTSN